jgi:hypothetical protein
MKYLCLCYAEEESLDRLPPRELDALLEAQVACDERLRARGHVVASESLASVRAATTVRVRQGQVSVTDGPFAETKEQLGGFFLIEARDLNDAIRIASQLPSARYGCLEIRPVWEIRRYVADLRARAEKKVEPPVDSGGAGSTTS